MDARSVTEPVAGARVHHEGKVAIVRLEGEIDGFAEEVLAEAYEKAVREEPEALLLDFSGVGYINSTGIALIVGLLSKARAAGRRMLACSLSEHYREIFRITRLSDFIEVFPDEKSALESVTAKD